MCFGIKKGITNISFFDTHWHLFYVCRFVGDHYSELQTYEQISVWNWRSFVK